MPAGAARAACPMSTLQASTRWRLAAAALLVTLSAGCAAPRTAPPAAGFDAWSERFAADWMRGTPEWASMSRYFSGAEQDALDRELPAAAERRERQRRLAQEGLAVLDAFDAAALSPAQRQAAATLRWSLQRTLAAQPYEDHGFAFNQFGGLQVRSLRLLTSSHPMRRPVDVDSYLARLAQLPARFDEATAGTRRSVARGILPPRFILERARGQFVDFLAAPPEQNLFVTALAQRSAGIDGLTPAAREAALAQARTLVASQVRPAYERALALLDELLPRSSDDAGLWRLPDGDAAYAQALAANTTTTMSADEIHRLGQREVARIEAQMDAVLRGLGRSQGSVTQRLRELNLSLQPPAEPDPRPALIARYAAYVADAQRRAEPLFNIKPKAPVIVQREPALTERTAAASYTTPAADGSRPGIFWAPLPGPSFNVLGMRSLAVHEAVPGHHFQLALQQEEAGLPRWRQFRVFGGGSAHSEGWALYAEMLAIEQGWYADDPHALLGALNSVLFRARRLVVDTGLHAKRWTRQQAIDYGISAAEVERYVVNPGQATAYMVGALRILALREQARTALGPRFSLPAFHDLVLRTGSVPLDVLAEVVGEWVAAQQRGA